MHTWIYPVSKQINECDYNGSGSEKKLRSYEDGQTNAFLSIFKNRFTIKFFT